MSDCDQCVNASLQYDLNYDIRPGNLWPETPTRNVSPDVRAWQKQVRHGKFVLYGSIPVFVLLNIWVAMRV